MKKRAPKATANIFADAPPGLSDEVRVFVMGAIADAIRLAKVIPDFQDVDVPKDQAGFETLVTRGVSRALSLATSSKEASDAVKAATWWHKTLYGDKEDEPYGGALGGADA